MFLFFYFCSFTLFSLCKIQLIILYQIHLLAVWLGHFGGDLYRVHQQGPKSGLLQVVDCVDGAASWWAHIVLLGHDK